MISISVPITVQLDDKQQRRVALAYLSSLKKDEWVEADPHGTLVLMHEVATSHKFDMPVNNQNPVRIKFVQAVQKFERALEEYEREW